MLGKKQRTGTEKKWGRGKDRNVEGRRLKIQKSEFKKPKCAGHVKEREV